MKALIPMNEYGIFATNKDVPMADSRYEQLILANNTSTF